TPARTGVHRVAAWYAGGTRGRRISTASVVVWRFSGITHVNLTTRLAIRVRDVMTRSFPVDTGARAPPQRVTIAGGPPAEGTPRLLRASQRERLEVRMVTQGRTGDDGGAAQLPQWRMGMRVRGGRITHTIARVGWVVFGAVGIVLAGAFAVLFGVTDDDPEIGVAPTVIGGMIVFLPLCVVPATLVGLGAQYGARAWLRTAPRVVSQRDRDEQELAAQLDEAGLHGGTRWARHYTRCLRAVGGFHDIIDELPEGAASDWFGDIGERLDEQLAEALR